MRNVPVFIWIALIASLGLAVYYYNQYKKEQSTSSSSTQKNFSGGSSDSVSYGDLMAKLNV